MISAIAEFPDRIKRILIQRNNSPFHAYCIAICITGQFEEVYLDDKYYYFNQLIEIEGQREKFSLDGKDRIAFGHNNGDEIWACMVEKAYAKVHGSYEDLIGGRGDETFFDLTGAPSEVIRIESSGRSLVLDSS